MFRMDTRAFCLFLISLASVATGEPVAAARATLARAGVRNGLALVLGEDVGFAQALANESRLFVQLVAPDDRAALNWRRMIDGGEERSEISVVSHAVNPLPYARDVINLLVVKGETHCPPPTEIRRVLTPGGTVALVGAPAAFVAEATKLGLIKVDSAEALIFRKPPLPAYEDWGNIAGGPELGNSLPDSTIEPTPTLRWRAGPRWQARDYHYDALACGGGVLVYREIAVLPGTVDKFQRILTARDAYNGRELWRHLGLPTRRPLYGFNVSPVLAVGEGRICVDRDGTMICLDAANGKDLFSIKLSRKMRQVVIHRQYLAFGCDGLFAVHSLADGRALWSKPMNPRTGGAIKDHHVYLSSGKKILAYQLDTGAEVWTFDTGTDAHPELEFREAPFCTDPAVHYTKSNKEQTFVFGLDRKSGQPVWNVAADNPKTVFPGFRDMEPRLSFIAFSDEIWCKFKKKATPPPGYTAVMTCLDAGTGKVKQKFSMNNDSTHCWATKGAGDYLFYAKNQFLNRKTRQVTANGLVRSICGIGHIPAERQLFMLPHNCRCSTLIRGVLAMGKAEKNYVFDKRPAPTPSAMGGKHTPQPDTPTDWPMFRGTAQRSNSCRQGIGTNLKMKWTTPVGRAGLTQAVAAYGMVFLSDSKAQRVIALDSDTGALKWLFPTDSRVSYPPALHKGVCLFGTAGGWVWALDARSGAPLWKLRAAPDDCFIGSQDRFESRWPVVGDVLVQNDIGYVSAGRAGTIDGGVQVLAFDPASGSVAWNKAFTNTVSADLLVGAPAGDGIMMNARLLNPATRTLADRCGEPAGCLNIVLHSIGGLGSYTALDDYLACTERHQISARREMLGDRRIAGLNIAFSEKISIATARVPRKGPAGVLAPEHRLLAAEKPKNTCWDLPASGMRVDGMVVAPETVYWIGGSPSDDPKVPSVLQIWATADGKSLKSLTIGDRAISDGLSIAGNKLFIVTRTGKLICYQGML